VKPVSGVSADAKTGLRPVKCPSRAGHLAIVTVNPTFRRLKPLFALRLYVPHPYSRSAPREGAGWKRICKAM